MQIATIARRTEKVLADNSPLILTSFGVAGVFTTAFLTGKASWNAAELLAHEKALREDEFKFRSHVDHMVKPEPMTNREIVQLLWPEFVPAVGSGVFAAACIIASNRISTRRAAALATAYSLSEKAWEEYREKIKETLGATKEQKARDELQQERLDRDPPRTNEIIVVGKGDVLFRDSYSGRYFESSLEDVKSAQNRLNHRVINDNYASLTDFYDFIGLERTTVSDEVGWNVDKLLEMDISTAQTDDGRPCFVVDFHTVPIRDYYRLH